MFRVGGIGQVGRQAARGRSVAILTPNSTSLPSYVTFTRPSAARLFNPSGILEAVGNDVLRVDYNPSTLAWRGWLIEPNRTNISLWNRDLTNAAWVKTSATATLNQTGIDGEANTASLLAATGANATCLQTVTLASSQRSMSAYVRRVSGTGTIEMTGDGGTTWTPITITSSWARYSLPAATITNPQFGFRITTSGDSIAVDYVQNEDGPFPSSAILTTTGATTRAADRWTINTLANIAWNLAGPGTLVIEYEHAGVSNIDQTVLAVTNGTNNNLLYQFNRNTSGTLQSALLRNNVNVVQARFDFTAASANQIVKQALAWATNDVNATMNGVLGTNDTVADITTDFSQATQLRLGRDGFNTNPFFGWIRSLIYYPTRLPNATLQALTV